MKRFVKTTFTFTILLFGIVTIAFLVPPTPRAATSLLFSKQFKDSLLIHESSPRMILVGGSNVSFGYNSQLIKDSLGYNPINTSIHASLGLVYMMNDVIDHVKADDIVILSSEYNQFFGHFAYGGEELLRTVIDVDKSSLSQLSFRQLMNITPHLLKFTFSKLKLTEYFSVKQNKIYGKGSFNSYGDAIGHWGKSTRHYSPYETITVSFNPDIISEIQEFNKRIRSVGATLLIVPPAVQQKTYDNLQENIGLLYSKLSETDIPYLSNHAEYAFTDSLTFNTPYHLTAEGTTLRTLKFIADYSDYVGESK
ncbi:MAG: hypothetical protein JXR19_09405 [Bacteroidia bacterium]